MDSLDFIDSHIDLEMPRMITVKIREEPSYSSSQIVNVLTSVGKMNAINIKDTWMETLMNFLLKGKLPVNTIEAHKVKSRVKRYLIIIDRLYRRSTTELCLLCLPPKVRVS